VERWLKQVVFYTCVRDEIMGMLERFLTSSMVLEPVPCPSCNSTNVVKNGKSDEGF
jgi:transposase-like protein